jgi:NAD(P)-dependent dehydrogenase (short-subunit alcohol dehydrogenase family)
MFQPNASVFSGNRAVQNFGGFRMAMRPPSVIPLPPTRLSDCDLDTWNRTIDVNLRSYYLCMRHAAVMMRDANVEGSIVNITVGVTRGVPNRFSYITSKGGVNFMTMSAALDLAPYGIRVNAIGSGPVGTAVGYRTMEGRAYENLGIPLGRIGEPEDIANAAAFLSSDAARYITAALLPVDGGGIVGSMGAGHQLDFSRAASRATSPTPRRAG